MRRAKYDRQEELVLVVVVVVEAAAAWHGMGMA